VSRDPDYIPIDPSYTPSIIPEHHITMYSGGSIGRRAEARRRIEHEKFLANEKKMELKILADGRCVVCGKPLDPTIFDLAHRIRQSDKMIDLYGREVIYHPLNMLPTCHGSRGGKSCNDACNISFRPRQVESLVAQIKRAIQHPEELDLADEYRAIRAKIKESQQ